MKTVTAVTLVANAAENFSLSISFSLTEPLSETEGAFVFNWAVLHGLGSLFKQGRLKQEAFFESQESGVKNQDEDGLVVNGDGELVAEVATADAVMPVDDAGTLECSSATAGKILTLSPLEGKEDGCNTVKENHTLSPVLAQESSYNPARAFFKKEDTNCFAPN